MATYTYKCSDCNNIFNIKATIQEKEEGKSGKFVCPKCRSKNIKQEFSIVNFIKNIFKNGNKDGGCCSGGDACDISCKPDGKEKDDRRGKNNNGGCCG